MFKMDWQVPSHMRFRPEEFKAAFWLRADATLKAAAERIKGRAQNNTPWSKMKEGYGIEREGSPAENRLEYHITFEPADGLPMAFFWSIESGSKAHWPPWGADSRVAAWAEKHNTTPYIVARAISRKDYEGRHLFQEAWDSESIFVMGAMDRLLDDFMDLPTGPA